MYTKYLIWYSMIAFIETANILSIVHWPSKSHFLLVEPLLKRLSERGHNVDVVTHYPHESFQPRYNEISIAGTLPLHHNNLSIECRKLKSYKLVHFSVTKSVHVCASILDKIVINTGKTYDLIFTQIFGSDCMLGFAHTYNASIVSFDSMVSLPWSTTRVGNIDNPSYIPNFFVLATQPLGFFKRVENTLAWIFTPIMYHIFQAGESNDIVRKFFGSDAPDLNDLIYHTSLVFLNNHFIMNHVRPTVPNLIEVGGLHLDKPKPLSEYYKNLLNTTSKGIIYLTMGSSLTTESFEPQKLQAMLNAFAELPYKVLWKADVAKLSKKLQIPRNVHFERWMPQLDILCHPNVKLFVSHGGLLGSYEAVYCSVPRLGIPIFADQETNIRYAEKLEIAIKVAYEDINKQTILKAAKTLLDDPSYKKNVQRVSHIFRDRPISPLDEAVYWIDYVIKYKGAFHLRNNAADLPWFEYYCVDVVTATFVITLSIYLVTVFVRKII